MRPDGLPGISRRQALAGGGSILAVLGSGDAFARPLGASPVAGGGVPALLLLDTSLPGWSEAARAAEHAGVPFARFAGDPGSVWLDHLEPLWRREPSPIAGVTFGGALFCAEQLARGRGLERALCRPIPTGFALSQAAELAIGRAARPPERGGHDVAVLHNRPIAWALVPRRQPARRAVTKP